MAIKKPPIDASHGRIHKQHDLPDDLVTFSFRHLSLSEKYTFPAHALINYVQALFERLRSVSDMRVNEIKGAGKGLRCHSIDWTNTTEPDGFAHLSQQLRDCEPRQFSVSANAHGRVHGILIDNVFYVVWFDPNHALYR